MNAYHLPLGSHRRVLPTVGNRTQRNDGGVQPQTFLCGHCGEELSDEVIRFRLGGVEYKKCGVLFTPDRFEDDTEEKSFHEDCIACPAYVLAEDWCMICNHEGDLRHQFYPDEAVVEVREGRVIERGRINDMRVTYAHFMCLCDDWDLPLWVV
jgi:hypothetical protein